MYTYIHSCIYTYTYISIHRYVHIRYVHIYMCVRVQNKKIILRLIGIYGGLLYIYVYIYIYIHIYIYIYIYIIYVYIHTYTHIYIYIYKYIYIHIYIYIYTCVCVCRTKKFYVLTVFTVVFSVALASKFARCCVSACGKEREVERKPVASENARAKQSDREQERA